MYRLQAISILLTIPSILYANSKIDRYSEAYVLRCILAVCIVISILVLLKFWLLYRDFKHKTGKIRRLQRDLAIGYGGIAICGVVPQVTVLLVGFQPYKLLLCICVCNLSPFFFIVLFFLEHSSYYEVNTSKKAFFLKLCIVFLHLVFMTSCWAYSIKFPNEKDQLAVAIVTTYYAVMFSLYTAEFFVVLNFAVTIVEHRASFWNPNDSHADSENENQIPPDTALLATTEEIPVIPSEDVYSNQPTSPTGLECNICMLGYTETVTPRVLIGCGHTVCQECIVSLPKPENRVVCPFCRKHTKVPGGSATQLPKNYAIMDLVRSRII
ncbi:hypothetical protein CRE_19483 [Caenorhabditis remanei]|uniref:RING-type domain-containing protein n=1 Tax=Caenorhabditis remanei TaxID=31234 RepID=E3NG60_CAERE|nr:hypothetical protein CRE_19483 [Caenorhabditis remanei]